MFERYRSLRITVLILSACLLVVIVGGFTWYGLTEYNKQRAINIDYQEHAQKDRAKASEEIAQRCRDKNFIATRSCISKALETYYHEQSTDQDLQAQKDMAYWAQLVFWATCGTVAAGLGAVIFLAKDIRVGREIGEAQTRAYLSINWVNAVYSSSEQGDVMHWRIEFQLANSGQTPARKVQYRADIVTKGSETIGEIHTLPDISGGYNSSDIWRAEINQDSDVFENGLIDELRYDLRVEITFWFIDVFKNPQVEPIHFGGVKNFSQGPHGGIGLRCIVVDKERSD